VWNSPVIIWPILRLSGAYMGLEKCDGQKGILKEVSLKETFYRWPINYALIDLALLFSQMSNGQIANDLT